ncbi:MAG: DUF6062 family protein [Candidatus Bathyarchaeia archaeon]
MSIDVTYPRIERIIKSDAECFLCALEDEIERKYIDTYLSELVMDSKAREKLVKSGGFCNHHFYRMLITAAKPGSSDGHGIALITQSIIERLLHDLHKQRKNQGEISIRTANCPACTHLASFMKVYIKKIIELLSSHSEEFLKLFKDSKSLCIPHFALLFKMLKNTTHNQETIKIIVEVEERNLQRLQSELSEYIRRQSYEFSEADRKSVEDVPLRSVQRIVGRRGISVTGGSLANEQC